MSVPRPFWPFVLARARRATAGLDDPVDEARARAFRGRRLQAVMRLTPVSMAANVLNIGLLGWAFRDTAPPAFLLFWSLGILGAAARGLLAWWRMRRRGPIDGASPHALRRAEFHAVALAALWAAPPLVLFHDASPAQQLLLATVTTGMLGAGGFALATLPRAGTAYVVVLGLGAAITILWSSVPLAWQISGLLVSYCIVVIRSVWSTADLFGARLRAEAEAARQHEVIGLLLRDFEESASDVLWEIDVDGRLMAVSPRLVDLFGLAGTSLAAVPLVEVLAPRIPDRGDAQNRLDALRARLAAHAPFRDVVICGTRANQVRWWSFSAKPRREADGRFAGWRGVVSDVTDSHLANQRLEWLAHNDTLTGLGNRHQFLSRLAELMPRTRGAGQSLAVVYVDFDHFKAINDGFGHSAGDAVLRQLGERMQATARRTDTVARLGGDEFAILLASVARVDEVEHFCRRLLASLAEPCEVSGVSHRVRCSMGVAIAPTDGTDLDTLLNHADMALYAAKTGGRNAIRFFTGSMADYTRRRIAIEDGLREAIARREFHLVFQPMVSVHRRRLIGFEALLRWRHPELGDVSPSEFITIAEETGQVGPIGRWVLESACREAATWPTDLTVAVNVSPVQATSPELVPHVLGALQQSGLSAGRLELEITESAVLRETESATRAIHQLRTVGCRIALDDFGTGYSALSYLRQFPFQTLKVDRSLITGLDARVDAQAIVRMIVGLAQSLELQTVAEGVEDASQFETLARFGCDHAQGFYISEPMAAPQVRHYLDACRRSGLPA